MELGVGEYTQILLQMCRVWDEAPVNPIDSRIADHVSSWKNQVPLTQLWGLQNPTERRLSFKRSLGRGDSGTSG